jgi:Amt family ammonium transporter
MAFVTLGTFMLWTGWYGFNSGSAYLYSAAGAPRAALERTASRATINTTLGGSAAGLVALLVSSFISGTYDLRVSCNGVLSGLVTATPMCGFVEPWAAAVAGALSGAGYIGLSRLLLRLRIDDPLDSAAVHFGSGTLGTLLLALAAKPSYVATLIPTNDKAAAAIAAGGPQACGGVFYSSLGWTQLGMQVLAVAVVTAFTGSIALAVFWVLRRRGLLRVDHATELAGIDNMDHGGPAYPEFGGPGGGGGGGMMQDDNVHGLVRH